VWHPGLVIEVMPLKGMIGIVLAYLNPSRYSKVLVIVCSFVYSVHNPTQFLSSWVCIIGGYKYTQKFVIKQPIHKSIEAPREYLIQSSACQTANTWLFDGRCCCCRGKKKAVSNPNPLDNTPLFISGVHF
jgi:hypothetical protein